MPVTIGEFEVIAEPASTPTPGSTTGNEGAPADPRPAALQQAIQESLLGQTTPEDALKTAAENSGL